MTSLNSLDFCALAKLYTSMGPHGTRELAHFAGVSHEVAQSWADGTGRPQSHQSRRIRTYLLSKLANVEQLKLDDAHGKEDYAKAVAVLSDVANTWDGNIEHLNSAEMTDDKREAALKDAAEKKDAALATVRRNLSLPKE